jgi:PhnB protein
MTVKAITEGYHSLTPYIACRNATAAIDFYKRAFGAQEIMRMPGPGGKIMHAELKIGDSFLFLADDFSGQYTGTTGGPISLMLYTENVDEVFNRAVAAGARAEMPLQNMFWGDRYGKLTDPFGNLWSLAMHIEDVSPEEMQRRSAAAAAQFAAGGKA